MNSKPAPSLTFEIDEIDSDYRPDKAFETYLFSEERLRSSPELWPEQSKIYFDDEKFSY